MVGTRRIFVWPRSRRPRAEARVAVTVVSAMPWASLLIVLYVAGATRKASNGASSERCSARGVSRSTTGFVVAHSRASRAT